MAVFARRVTDAMGDNAPAPPASNELRAEAQLVFVMGGFISKQTHDSARQAVEAVAVKAGLNDDMVKAMSVEIALPPKRNGAIVAFVTCANVTATDILYPLPEDESAPIPVRRIDMRPTPVYAKIVLSATDAADGLMVEAFGGSTSGPREKIMVLFQDKKGRVPLDDDRVLARFRVLAEEKLALAHPGICLHMPESPVWTSTHSGQHKSRCSLQYRVHASARFLALGCLRAPGRGAPCSG